MSASAQRPSPSTTQTQTADSYILRLRVEEESNQPEAPAVERHVEWVEGTVNNEHMNKKKSKKCCIYHKPRRFDESDSESCGSDTESDEEFSKKYPQFAVKKKITKHKRKAHCHGHSHDSCCPSHNNSEENEKHDG